MKTYVKLSEAWSLVYNKYIQLGFPIAAHSLRESGSVIRQCHDPKILLGKLNKNRK